MREVLLPRTRKEDHTDKAGILAKTEADCQRASHEQDMNG